MAKPRPFDPPPVPGGSGYATFQTDVFTLVDGMLLPGGPWDASVFTPPACAGCRRS